MFTGTSNGASGGITSGPNTDFPASTGLQTASNIIDLGVLNGVPFTAAGGGGARDIGVGDDPALKLTVICTTTFTGGASTQVVLSGAPDAGNNTPGAYTTMYTGPVINEAQLLQGAYLANVDVPRQVPGQPLPRYLRLQFTNGVGTHTTGGVEGTITLDEFRQPMGTGGQLGGYPPGIVIAN